MVKEMSEGDSQELLQTSLIDKSLIGGKDVIAKLLDNLTHLPLAIKQAAAYMNKNTMSVFDYLGLYEANDEDLIHLLSAEFEDQGRYTKAAFKSLETSGARAPIISLRGPMRSLESPVSPGD
jgi:hypothetical protein